MSSATLLFLNGTSSAGKTSIAQALQKVMDEPYLYFSADVFKPMLPPYKEGRGWAADEILDRKNFGYYGCLAAMLDAGNFVVGDQAICREYQLKKCTQTLATYRAFFIGVRCPFEVAERRERERGDRMLGLVKEQFELVHRHGIYDLEVDSSLLSPEENASRIWRHVAENEPSAFRKLAGAK